MKPGQLLLLHPCGGTELEKCVWNQGRWTRAVTVALYWDVKCLWFRSSSFARNVCQNNTKMIYFGKIVHPLNSFWCFLFSCPYQRVALRVSGFPTGLLVELLVSGSLSACNHMCVHTCVSCLCVCVFPVLSVRQHDSPLCECVCVQVNYSYTGHRPKAVRRIQQQPVIALCCWSSTKISSHTETLKHCTLSQHTASADIYAAFKYCY